MSPPTGLQRVRIAATVIVALAAALLVTRGLGGGNGSSTGAEQVLDQAFGGGGASSAKFAATGAIALQGLPSEAANPLSFEATGAFDKGTPGAQARFELRATVSAVGNTQSFNVVSNGQQAIVTAGGQTQSLPAGSGASSFAVDPRRWLKNPVDDGTAQVDGASTRHVSADVDVAKMLTDLQVALPSSGVAGEAGLSQQQRDTLRNSVQDAKAEIYTGATDHVLRRLTVTGTVQGTNPLSNVQVSGRLVFDLRITDVGKPQLTDARRTAGGSGHRRSPGPGHPGAAAGSKQPANARRSAQAYVSCVQRTESFQALERCQAQLP